jgi:MSHA biogenesis protein MshQ
MNADRSMMRWLGSLCPKASRAWCSVSFARFALVCLTSIVLIPAVDANAASIEFNNTGGSTATNGLHFYIEDTTKIQARRLNNTGQVYSPTAVPPSTSLDNGIFIRANGVVYGPGHNVTTFTPTMYSTYAISPALPVNPSSSGIQQTATGTFGITAGPQVSVLWKYTTPLDFLTAEVTLTIPAAYAVSAANPVRYYHVFDTYLGGSDSGCGVFFTDSNGKRVIGTYPPASGTTCPSSTVIPSGVSVVESFRERSGNAFSEYCAAGWATFFTNGAPNCSVLQTAVMSNTVVTTYQDTGIGVEFDFTAAGTYTFSYDFVVGSPTVPPYDHLEIQHDGVATLCPESVTVLACTSSTVPCPVANIVNTGTLTGSVTTAPAVPAVTVTPATFSIGASNATQIITLQAAAAGTVVLGTSGLSAVPLNGTKCWNTATSSQGCTMTIVSTPCVSGYECLETGAAYNNLITTPSARNPLYTKLSGTNFKFDVVALQSSGAQATTYTAAANVTMELFDDSASPAPTCSAYASPVASQAITFVASDLGRKTLSANVNVTNAFSKLRCRVRDTNLTPTIYGCSSDDFAVRPPQLTITAPALANAALTGTPKAVAGAAFALDASAGVAAGYTGTPVIDASKVQDHVSATIATGTLSGVFSAGTGAKASGAAFRYLDVGNIKFVTDAVVDSSFTSVDQAADCVAGSTSNSLVGGKYGCNIGSVASATLGRWYPSHYSFAGTLSPACLAGAFTYMDQDALGVSMALKAHASTGAAAAATDPVTSRYTAGYTNLAPVTVSGDNSSAAVSVTRLANPAFPTMPSTVLWTNGQFQINDIFSFSKLSSPDGPYDFFKLKAALTDTDGGVLIGTSTAQETNTTKIRWGRIQLQNAYGSERLPLSVPLVLQYWNGSWQKNAADSCTSVAGAHFTWAFPAGTAPRVNNLAACESAVTVTGTAPSYTVSLSAPGLGNAGWADLTLNLGATAIGSACTTVNAGTGYSGVATTANAPWLQYNWTGTVGNPSARATFGVYKSPLIYRRENY